MKLVVFGDSLSDDGNGIGPFANNAFPLPPYYKFRFSNGPVWIESFPTPDLTSFAYGGALVNQSGYQLGPPSLMAQINDYLISLAFNLSRVADETQYVFWGGGNDILFSPISNDSLTDEGVKGQLALVEGTLPWLVSWQVGKLIDAGATNILVMLLQPWSQAPALQPYSVKQRQVLDDFTLRINKFIQGNVSTLSHAGVTLQFFDTFSLMVEIFDSPQKFGLVNASAPCLGGWPVFLEGIGGQEAKVCSEPDKYFFWDGYGHPTAKIHGLLAQEVMKFLDWGE
jgi:phospholipase/lecithinase/hemolysin